MIGQNKVFPVFLRFSHFRAVEAELMHSRPVLGTGLQVTLHEPELWIVDIMETQDFPGSQKDKALCRTPNCRMESAHSRYEAPARAHPGLTCLLVSASAPHTCEAEGTDPFLFIEERSWVSTSASESLN